MPDTTPQHEMSEEAALVNLNLRMANSLHDVYDILTGAFSDLSPADKAAVVRKEFFDDPPNDEAMIREVLDNLHKAGNSPDNALQTYIMAEVFAALAENNDPFPLIPPLQKHLGRLTDAEYARPAKLSEAFQEAIMETLGIEPPDNQKMAIDVRNPFAALAKPQNGHDADSAQPPTHANLRRYLGRNGK
ncbi:MAG: hypothetical protein HND56_10330 [Pseudomonadota bacterium]|nr:hypothetical protein [Pseudomonadota bacterium]QKK06061.1 MAG: hypothetical protein HND56_10330 [Pseudomonadota bacterium]